jgi:hypothetical protein
MPLFGRPGRLRAALLDAGVTEGNVDQILGAVRGRSARTASVTTSVAERWAWRVANGELSFEEFETHVWHATRAENPASADPRADQPRRPDRNR